MALWDIMWSAKSIQTKHTTITCFPPRSRSKHLSSGGKKCFGSCSLAETVNGILLNFAQFLLWVYNVFGGCGQNAWSVVRECASYEREICCELEGQSNHSLQLVLNALLHWPHQGHRAEQGLPSSAEEGWLISVQPQDKIPTERIAEKHQTINLGHTSSRLSSITWSYSQPSSGTSRCLYSSASSAISEEKRGRRW